MTAFAGVGRGDQHKAAGIFHMGIGPRNHDAAGFDRLAQGFEKITGKLWELIHEQNAIMRKRNFPWLCVAPAAHNCGGGSGVMWLSKRSLTADPTILGQASQRIDH